MRRPARSRPDHPRLPRMARRAAARTGGPPRRHVAGVPPHRRGAVRRWAGEGCIRHGDTGFGDQHASKDGGARAPGEVQRRAAHAVDAGGVHAADRARGAPGHRRGGPRGGAVDSRRRPGRSRRARVHPYLPAAQFLCAVVQHDHQPGASDGACAGAQAAGEFVRAVPGGPVGGRVWCAASSAASGCSTRSPPNWSTASRQFETTARSDTGLRAAAPADLRTRARSVASVAAATAQGRQRCAGVAAPRRHHHHHPGQARWAGRGPGTRRATATIRGRWC